MKIPAAVKFSLFTAAHLLFIVSIHYSQFQTPSVSKLLWEGREIPVCWMNPDKDTDAKRKIVVGAISDTWGKHIGMTFLWSEKCRELSRVTSPEIRIYIDKEPYRSCSDIGIWPWKKTGGKWTLNSLCRDYTRESIKDSKLQLFTMYLSTGHYYDSVDERQALRFTAIHEFGHALGFFHEQVSDNVPDSCLDILKYIGSSADEREIVKRLFGATGVIFSSYDADSIMNYCRLDRFKDALSERDVVAVQSIYPKRPIVQGPDNDYYTITDLLGKKCLTVLEKTLKVELSTCKRGQIAQLWTFRVTSNNTFEIVPRNHSALTLTISKTAVADIVSGQLASRYRETSVQLGPRHGDASSWFRTPIGEGRYVLQLSLGGFVLDRDTWDPKRNKVILYKNLKGGNQLWRLEKAK